MSARNYMALLLVGQVRTFEKALPLFEQNFIEPLIQYYGCDGCDVFLASDEHNQMRGLNQSEKPTKVDNNLVYRVFDVIEHGRMKLRKYQFFGKWPDSFYGVRKNNWSKIPKDSDKFFFEERATIQWSLLREAWLMMETYEREMDFRYNVVIKSRPDVSLSHRFDVHHLELNFSQYIYTFSHLIFFGSRDFMEPICKSGIYNYGLYLDTHYFGNDTWNLHRFNFTSELQMTYMIREIANEYSLREYMTENPFICVRTDTEIVLRPWDIALYKVKPEDTHREFSMYICKFGEPTMTLEDIPYGLTI